ncbi:phage tail protein [Yersinia enterocolitica]|uniref:phage tail protein n=1 Tax=Yersinia enterocolitica TaxID=630 RepID=UPI001F5981B4|nr:phage tail protein [Yersinia enterocolitica]
MSVSGLKEAVEALTQISRFAVPKAQVQAVNRVAKRVVSRSLRVAAKEIVAGDNQHKGIPLRAIRRRPRLRQASLVKPRASIFVNRQPLTAIKLLSVSPTAPLRGKRGKALKIGPYRFRNGFIAQAPNGYWQIFERVGQARNPIRVIKIEVADTLSQVFISQTTEQMKVEMPKELGYALNYQLRGLQTR